MPNVERFADAETGFAGWRARLDTPRALPTPAVGSGRIFVGGGYGSHSFYAFDAATGRVAWHLPTRDDGPTAAVFVRGRVVFNTESCTIYVVDADDGKVVWEKWLGDPLRAQPAVAGEVVIMAYPARDRSYRLAALDLADGRPRWERELANEVITAPVVAGDRLYLSTYDGAVSCLEMATGRGLWSRDLRATSAPWVAKGEVYVAHREDRGADPTERVSALRDGSVTSESFAARAAYLRSKRGTVSGNTASFLDTTVGFAVGPAAALLDTSEALTGEFTVYGTWRYQGSRPCVQDGSLYATIGDELSASYVGGSSPRWTWRSGAVPAADRAVTPPLVCGGKVITGALDGQVRAWDVGTGALMWSVAVGAPVAWQPAVCGGWIYVGCEDGSLVAFATGDASADGWAMWGGGPGHNGAEAGPDAAVSRLVAEGRARETGKRSREDKEAAVRQLQRLVADAMWSVQALEGNLTAEEQDQILTAMGRAKSAQSGGGLDELRARLGEMGRATRVLQQARSRH